MLRVIVLVLLCVGVIGAVACADREAEPLSEPDPIVVEETAPSESVAEAVTQEPCPTVEEALWSLVVTEVLNRYTANVDALSEEFNTAAVNPSLLTDVGWQVDVLDLLDEQKAIGLDFVALDAPSARAEPLVSIDNQLGWKIMAMAQASRRSILLSDSDEMDTAIGINAEIRALFDERSVLLDQFCE